MRDALHRPHADDESEVRAALSEIAAGETVSMSADAFERWMVTGEGGPWPASSFSDDGTAQR